MTGTSRLVFVIALACTAPTAWGAPAPQGQDGFQRGVDLLRRGRAEEALVEFQKALAADLSSEEAYELWKETEHQVWLDLLVEGGEFELVYRHLMGLVNRERLERRNDSDAILEHVRAIRGDDVIERRRAITTLSAEHGEYAVPYMLHFLGDPDDDDGRVKVMHALTEMDSAVAPPLVEALSSDDRYLRTNVALVLGRIGDPRAAGSLLRLAETDEDAGVQDAARQAAERCGAAGQSPLVLFLQQGDDYHNRRPTVLRPHDYSDVVWSLSDGQLESTSVPRFLYNDEMAKKAYYRALEVNPTSLEARAGVARAYVDAQAKLQDRGMHGEDVGDLADQAAEATVAINAAGVDALDMALQWSVQGGDSAAGVALCSHLGAMASAPTPGLLAALRSNDGPLRAEAATVLGEIAHATGQAASPEAVAEMARTAAREVLQIAAVIDGETHRSESIRGALEAEGVSVAVWSSGGAGLSSLYRVPGVDLILVADRLPDMTAAQVLTELRGTERYQETPILLISEDPEGASEVYGDLVTDVVSTSEDADKVREALSGGVDGDRAEANRIAARAASTLARLAAAGKTDVGPAVDALANGLGSRPDEVAAPSARTLALAGGARHAGALVAVVIDESRSDGVRVASADAIAGILGREPESLSRDQATALHAILTTDASLAVRQAVSRAIGRMALDPETRAELMRQTRVNVRAEG